MASSLVVVVDRWGAGFLGPYGNTWLETPACCRLASQGWLVEHALADSLQLDSLYRSYWQGRHAACPAVDEPGLAARLAEQRIATQLISDESQILAHPQAAGFEDRLIVSPGEERTAASIDQTQLAKLFGEALAWLEHAPDPFHLWVHAAAMNAPWDAPYELRAALADEEDPPPPDSPAVPREALVGEVDPDKLLGLTQAYGAQVQLMDRCLGVLLDRLTASGTLERTLVAVVGARGFPLGEQGPIGAAGDALLGNTLHVPWMLRLPDRSGALVRTQALVQPADLYATLAAWHGLADSKPGQGGFDLLPVVRGEQDQVREQAVSIADHQRSIRTPVWHLQLAAKSAEEITDREPDEQRSSLFVKPDDRWEQNEVSGLCPEIVSQLTGVLDQFQQAAKTGSLDQLPPLAEELREGMN